MTYFFLLRSPPPSFFFFFFNDTATTEIYTLSLHDALPIWRSRPRPRRSAAARARSWRSTRCRRSPRRRSRRPDRKSTRLNSSHLVISYAVFCLKKKKITHFHSVPPARTHMNSRTHSLRSHI